MTSPELEINRYEAEREGKPYKAEIEVHCHLAAADYQTLDGKVTPRDPSYRVSLRMRNRDSKEPYQGKAWIRASAPCTIKCGSQTKRVDEHTHLEASANGGGMLHVEVHTDSVQPLELRVQTAFTGSGYLVVDASEETHRRLSTVQADDLAAARATSFDGKPLLPQGLQGAPERKAVADSLRNIIGKQPTLLSPQHEDDGHLVHANTRASATGPWAVLATQEQKFTPGDFANFEISLVDGIAFEGRHEAPLVTAEEIILWGFWDFISDVVDKGIKVVKIIYQAVKQGIETVIKAVVKTAEKAFEFIVDTAKQAAAVAQAFLNTVSDQAKRALEWLAEQIGWKGVLDTKKEILDLTDRGMNAFTTWLDELAGRTEDLQRDCEQLSHQVKEHVDKFLGMHSVSFGEMEKKNGPMEDALTIKGVNAYGDAMWLFQKYQDNGPRTEWLATAPGAFETAEDDPLQIFAKFCGHIKDVAEQQFPKIKDDVDRTLKDLADNLSNPSMLLKAGFRDLLHLAVDLIETMIKVAAITIADGLRFIGAMLKALIKVLKQPIEIPVLSALYRVIAGAELSVLDLCALMIAVPVHTLRKLIQATAGAEGIKLPKPVLQLGVLIATAISFIMTLTEMAGIGESAASDAKPNRWVSIGSAGLGLIGFLVAVPWFKEDLPHWLTIVSWVVGGGGVILSAIEALGGELISQFLGFFLGLLIAGFGIAAGIVTQTKPEEQVVTCLESATCAGTPLFKAFLPLGKLFPVLKPGLVLVGWIAVGLLGFSNTVLVSTHYDTVG